MIEQSAGIRAKVLTSAKLTTFSFAVTIVLRLISTVILTRLLAPEIYGVFAVVLVYLYVLEMFSDLGIRSLILTKEDELEDDFLRTCWTISILRGAVIALFSCIIGAVIIGLRSAGIFLEDRPYNASALPWALAVLGGTVIVTGMMSPMIYVQELKMNFGKVTAISIATNFIGVFVTITFAIYLRSVF